MASQEKLVKFIKSHLKKDVLEKSGRILYSSYKTLDSNCEVYILGVNPGGDPKDPKEGTIKESLKKLPKNTKNAYLNESFGGKEIGKHHLQKRLDYLACKLKFELKKACASNLSFIRTRKASEMLKDDIKECWPIHEKIITEIVKPKQILTFGKQPYEALKSLLTVKEEDSFPAGHGSYKCRWFRGNLKGQKLSINVLGVPHLSRYQPQGKKGVGEWLKKHWD